MGEPEESQRLEECNKDTPCFTMKTGLCKVIDVYDADTCTIIFFIQGTTIPMQQKVRLYGIDAPEMKPSLQASNREAIIESAIRAKKRVQELILNQIVMYTCKGHDKYGRFLASLTLSTGVDLAECLLKEGHGKPYFGGSKINL